MPGSSARSPGELAVTISSATAWEAVWACGCRRASCASPRHDTSPPASAAGGPSRRAPRSSCIWPPSAPTAPPAPSRKTPVNSAGRGCGPGLSKKTYPQPLRIVDDCDAKALSDAPGCRLPASGKCRHGPLGGCQDGRRCGVWPPAVEGRFGCVGDGQLDSFRCRLASQFRGQQQGAVDAGGDPAVKIMFPSATTRSSTGLAPK